MDCLFINPNSSQEVYQELANDNTAIEVPVWSLLLAEACRNEFEVAILDCDTERLSDNSAIVRIKEYKPKVVCFVVYGQNPNAGTTNMTGAIRLAKKIKESIDTKVAFIGSHTSALPQDVLSYKCVDYVMVGDGLHALKNLLRSDLKNINKISGLGWKDVFGLCQFNSSACSVSNLDNELPGYAWDLLPYNKKPFDLYRSHFWHANFDKEKRKNAAAIYTSLGCSFSCQYCLDENTKIIMSKNKNKPIKDVVIGDKIIGWNEKLSCMDEVTVINTNKRNVTEEYKIVLEDGKNIRCTGEHPFFVNGRWVEAKDLSVDNSILVIEPDDKLKFRMERYNPSYNSESIKKGKKTLAKKIDSGEYIPYLKTEEGKKHISKIAKERMLSSDNPSYRDFNKEKISKRMKNENNPMWKGGISKGYNNYSLEFRKTIRHDIKLRDSYTCQECGQIGGRLDVHHIDYNTKNNELCNLITLCKKCHGKTNMNSKSREEWLSHYRNKILSLGYTNCPHYVKIKSIIIIPGNFTVYNLECTPHNNYFAQYMLTHNCMISVINATDFTNKSATELKGMKFWSPEKVLSWFDNLIAYGVTTVRLSDEMFFLNKKYFEPILKGLIDRGYGKLLHMWAYARIDTVQEKYLELFRDAGIKWLALGIESANKNVRTNVTKGKFEDNQIIEIIDKIRQHDINIIGNYMYGLPEDDWNTMQQTLNLAMELNTEMYNGYAASALPGSMLHQQAVRDGIELPNSFEGYSFHSYECKPLPTKYLSAAEVLSFRDYAWQTYMTNPRYLNLVKNKFGENAVENIKDMSKIKLKRKILGD